LQASEKTEATPEIAREMRSRAAFSYLKEGGKREREEAFTRLPAPVTGKRTKGAPASFEHAKKSILLFLQRGEKKKGREVGGKNASVRIRNNDRKTISL